ncbi:serine hydrolase [Sphaerisporangium krabiense]|uniref:CubicO group peptidase (Beta-lactamase class C family) n=1 Tax=Sphaerisporangium krabiense TaxID=763782 RepID=A0A7W9DRH0_9ACTN|nr:serine hydrolase domain-containing protein [Sphaerisporangium krabiense]MBB5628089.1 CubicO group peptidase (beta-lactamase class C family) [Sphaerisporangium krabiense]GII62255.1 serine hydrolase [Sphaerisporangium krabiense]
MKRHLIGLVAATGLALFPAVAPAAHAAPPAAAPAPAAIDAYLAKAMKSTGLPGMSVVVTRDDTIVHAAGYGHDAEGRPITKDTPMQIASLSKSFTAMAVMTLVDEGEIKLDEPVAARLPEFRMADPRAAKITVRHLLNQTSGLSDTTVDIGAAQASTSFTGYVSTLSTGRLAADPGAHWEYCNVNYDVAARLVEVASGRPYGDYMRRRVFGPLGMTRSAIGRQAAEPPSKGFVSLYGAWVPRAALPGFANDGGSGGVVTTAADMGRWLSSQTGHGVPLVKPESLRAMHAPSAVQDYGMGWGGDVIGGARLLVHAGNLFTYTAVQAIDPDTGYGFAVMTNSASLYESTYDVLRGLVALSRGDTPEVPGRDRQTIELVLGLITLTAAALGVLGVLRSARWARRRVGSSGPRVAMRLVPALLPAALLAGYPALASVLMNGRTVTWEQLTYFPAPLTITVAAAAVAGVATTVARLVRMRSVVSSR